MTTGQRLGAWAAVLGAIVLVALGVAKVDVDASVAPFVSTGDRVHERMQLRDDEFGADAIVVSLRGGRGGIVLDPAQRKALIGLEGALAQLEDVAVVYGPGTVLNQTAKSTQNLLVRISGARDAIVAQQKAGGGKKSKNLPTLKEFDQRYGVLLAAALPVGLPTLENDAFVGNILFDKAGDPRTQWRFLVPDARSATILVRPRAGLDREAATVLVAAVRRTVEDSGVTVESSTISGVPVLTAQVADQTVDEAPLLGGLAVGAVALVLWLSRWTPVGWKRLVPVAAALLGTGVALAAWGWWGKPVSVGVAAFLPVLMGIGSDFPLYLARRRDPSRILVVVGASALAFASLALSPLPFVRDFGLTLAAGLVVTAGVGLLLARLVGIDPDAEPTVRSADAPRSGAGPDSTVTRWLPHLLGVGALAAVIGWAMLPRLDLASSPQELAAGSQAIQDITDLEERTGFSGDLTIMIEGDNVLDPEIVSWAVEAERAIVEEHGAEIRPLLTLRQLFRAAGNDPTSKQIAALAEILPSYLVGGVVNADRSVAALNYGITLDDVEDQKELIDDIDRILADAPDGYDVGVTGLPAVASGSLSTLSSGRYLVNIAGILASSLVIGLLLSKRRGLATAISAGLAAGWVFLAVWLLGASLNPLSMVAGALVTVTACEFTTMLAERREGVRVLGRTVLTAAVAGTVGYGVLMVSGMAVLSSFGLLLAGGVVASYLASFVTVAVLDVGREPLRDWSGPADPPSLSLRPARGIERRTKEPVS